MTAIDLTQINDIIRAVAADEIMPRFRKLAAGDVEMKGVNDPVTIADKETERRLTEEFTKYLPGSVVIGEESFAKDTSIMEHLDRDQPVWIIDPIDGTRNFVGGAPEFAVMVALVKNKQSIASWIHDPNSGDTVLAEKGAGVWLRGQKLRLADSGNAVGLVGSRIKKYIVDSALMPPAGDLPKIDIGSCAGFDYPRLFTGDVHFGNDASPRAAFLLYRHTNAWDHAPGLFLHHEAGGYSADWSAQPYDMSQPRSGLLIASDKDSWQRLYHLFQPLMQHTAKLVA